MAVGLVLAVTAVHYSLLAVNPTAVALSYVVVILLVASRWGLREAMAASVAATACLNAFFLPPVGTLHIKDPQNWIALAAFLLTALVVSELSSRARNRTLEAVARQQDLERLYSLSRSLLLSSGRPSIPAALAGEIASTFGLRSVGVYDEATETAAWAGNPGGPDVDAVMRTVAREGQPQQLRSMRLVPIRLGTSPIGSLAVPEGDHDETVVNSIANLAAIGLERARGLEVEARAEAARQSGELRATVLDALAHEFKTPLTSMKVAAADLRGSALTEQSRELAAIVEEDLDRLQSLVSDAVQMVRLDAGDFSLQLGEYRLSEIVTSTLRTLESRLEGRRVECRIPEDLCVQADRHLLDLALRQLLDNAAKYSPAVSPIEIRAGRTADGVAVGVVNWGPPIPEREQARLFERFYRGSQSRRVAGTGMGLAIVRQIAEAHHGSLFVSSAAGSGTEFRISLPSAGASS